MSLVEHALSQLHLLGASLTAIGMLDIACDTAGGRVRVRVRVL
jgi:hypothetical protein